MAYRTERKEVKREVAKATNKEYEKLYEKLKTTNRQNKLFKTAKQRDRQRKHVYQVKEIESNNGEILVEETKVKQR